MKPKLPELLLALGTALCIACLIGYQPSSVKKERFSPRDLSAILKDGTLRAVIEENPISYRIEGDTASGFDYEILHAFARHLKVQLEITSDSSLEQRIAGLKEGRYDLLAKTFAVNTLHGDSLAYTLPLFTAKYILVQRKVMPDSIAVRTAMDLKGKTVFIEKESPVLLRLTHLAEEIADTIHVQEDALRNTEQLIEAVANGEIDFAVCDEEVAKFATFENVDTTVEISFPQFRAWAVNNQSPQLLDTLNTWLGNYTKQRAYKKLIRKYFK